MLTLAFESIHLSKKWYSLKYSLPRLGLCKRAGIRQQYTWHLRGIAGRVPSKRSPRLPSLPNHLACPIEQDVHLAYAYENEVFALVRKRGLEVRADNAVPRRTVLPIKSPLKTKQGRQARKRASQRRAKERGKTQTLRRVRVKAQHRSHTLMFADRSFSSLFSAASRASFANCRASA